MKRLTIDMPVVAECLATECGYNVGMNCHARAITVGNSLHAGCDTFLPGSAHTHAPQMGGVGACKSAECRYNEDLQCVADTIRVAPKGEEVNCMTYAPE